MRRRRAAKVIVRTVLALLLCAPLGNWAAACQRVVAKPAIAAAQKGLSAAVLRAPRRARRRFLALRQRKEEPARAAVVETAGLAVRLQPGQAREAEAFLAPPDHPPA